MNKHAFRKPQKCSTDDGSFIGNTGNKFKTDSSKAKIISTTFSAGNSETRRFFYIFAILNINEDAYNV